MRHGLPMEKSTGKSISKMGKIFLPIFSFTNKFSISRFVHIMSENFLAHYFTYRWILPSVNLSVNEIYITNEKSIGKTSENFLPIFFSLSTRKFCAHVCISHFFLIYASELFFSYFSIFHSMFFFSSTPLQLEIKTASISVQSDHLHLSLGRSPLYFPFHRNDATVHCHHRTLPPLHIVTTARFALSSAKTKVYQCL